MRAYVIRSPALSDWFSHWSVNWKLSDIDRKADVHRFA